MKGRVNINIFCSTTVSEVITVQGISEKQPLDVDPLPPYRVHEQQILN